MQTILTLHLTDTRPRDWDESTRASTSYLLYKNILKRIDLLSTSQVGELYHALLNNYKTSKNVCNEYSLLLEEYWNELSVRAYNEGDLCKRTRSGKAY